MTANRPSGLQLNTLSHSDWYYQIDKALSAVRESLTNIGLKSMNGQMHPQVKALLEATEKLGVPKVADCTPDEARVMAEETASRLRARFPALEVARVDNLVTGASFRAVPVRVYRPSETSPAPALVYFHGGGHVFGSLDTHDHVCRSLCMRSGGVVIAVDYALAPERPFPEGVDDAFAALRWVVDQAAALGVDPDRIAVGGDSAGANLAAVVALLARDAAGPALTAQALVYPVTDYRGGTASYARFGSGFGLLDIPAMDWFRGHYLPRAADHSDWRAAPHLAPSHAGLPPALVLLAECDLLHDEGAAYADQLAAAGVPVERQVFEGMIHAFFGWLGPVDATARAHDAVAGFLRSAWGSRG